MSFLRIGTNCVVVDENQKVLLSQRGDLNTWNLPGGRLDRNEYLWDAAAREVREETGIEVEIIRLTGLYYSERWQRLNAVFLAKPIGGMLQQKTYETRRNDWFSVGDLPQKMFDRQHILDATENGIYLRTISTPLQDYRRLRRKFALRWIENLLRGKPEPRYPRFRHVAVLLSISPEPAVLRSIVCDGTDAPWQQLSPSNCEIPKLIGVHHLPAQGEIRYVYMQTNGSIQSNENPQIEDSVKNDYSQYLTQLKTSESTWLMDAKGGLI